ncbi:hypothetical protein BCR34DRAFT_573529 [Clohesyomyces aquaticus]|uniref:Uncharacterized protein n=1 Tax=Clohesyomyces aquaticus TaxID=1231657 RepID=A0A1Y1YZW6_9PLEO|nr:hypothetical protein BCR34DRAFT_573529 [Clohesyomyces aquaticus]
MASAWPDFGAPSAPIMPAPMTRSHVKTRSYVEDDDSVDEAPAPLADLPPVTIPKSLQKNTQPAAKTGKVSIKFKPMVQSPPIAPITGHVTRAQSNATAAAVTAPPPPPPGDPNLDDMQFRMCKFLLHIQELMGWSAEKTLLDVTQADADMLHAQLKAAKEESEESEVLVKMLDLIEKFQELRALHAEYLEMVDEYGLGVEKKEVEDGEN